MSNITDLNLMKSIVMPTELPRLPASVNPAQWMHERIVRSINDFEASLDQEHEIGARLVAFGPTLTFHVEDVGYWGPDLITFRGRDDKSKPIELLQHISQISVLLVAVEKLEAQPKRIGFALLEKLKSTKSE